MAKARLYVREWREARGLGVRELARLAQVQHQTVLSIERGQDRVSLTTLGKLSTALKCEPYELLKPPR